MYSTQKTYSTHKTYTDVHTVHRRTYSTQTTYSTQKTYSTSISGAFDFVLLATVLFLQRYDVICVSLRAVRSTTANLYGGVTQTDNTRPRSVYSTSLGIFTSLGWRELGIDFNTDTTIVLAGLRRC